MSTSVNLVKEIFILYYGRVSNKDLWNIGKQIYFSIAIGGSEIVEFTGEELVSKAFEGVSQSIPFVGKLLGSITDGIVNGLLLARISYITENYCTMTLITSAKDLKPSPKFITDITFDIVGDLITKVKEKLKKESKFRVKTSVEKMAEFVSNPFKDEIDKTTTESPEVIIRKHTVGAMVAAVVPLPVVDSVAITAVEINMLMALTKYHGIKWNKKLAKKIIGGSGIAGAAVLGQSVWGSIIKFFPGIGAVAGGAIQMSISGQICYALSKAYNSFLEKGIDKFDDDEFDKELAKHLEEGKQVSEEL